MSLPSCWWDCCGCGCCREFKEYDGDEEIEEDIELAGEEEDDDE